MDVGATPTEPQGTAFDMGANAEARSDVDTAGSNSSPLSESTPLRHVPEVGAG